MIRHALLITNPVTFAPSDQPPRTQPMCSLGRLEPCQGSWATEIIGREAGVKVVVGEDALYGDALRPPGSGGDTYLKMIRHNMATIVSNLSGA